LKISNFLCVLKVWHKCGKNGEQKFAQEIIPNPYRPIKIWVTGKLKKNINVA